RMKEQDEARGKCDQREAQHQQREQTDPSFHGPPPRSAAKLPASSAPARTRASPLRPGRSFPPSCSGRLRPAADRRERKYDFDTAVCLVVLASATPSARRLRGRRGAFAALWLG